MNNEWDLLQRRADSCERCKDEGILEIACPRKSIGIPIPKPSPVCLFVSCNPPRFNAISQASDNFWNDQHDNLRANLFDILQIHTLQEFTAKAYFLVHALKCATKNPQTLQTRNALSKRALALCVSAYLRQEVDSLAPRNICLLGGIAKQAFEEFSRNVREWRARPSEGKSTKVTLSYGEANCLLTCLPVYPRLVALARMHISNWMRQMDLIDHKP